MGSRVVAATVIVATLLVAGSATATPRASAPACAAAPAGSASGAPAAAAAGPVPGPGSLDPSFGTKGIAVADLEADETPLAVSVGHDRKILVVGRTEQNGDSGFHHIALARFTQAGRPDQSFGVNGQRVLPGERVPVVAGFQPDGKVVLTGYTSGASTWLMRLTQSGALDQSFGAGGVSSDAVLPGTAIAFDAKGRIVVAAHYEYENLCAGQQPISAWELARYLPNGAPDRTFSTTDQFWANGLESGATSLALQPDGKIVVGGVTMVASHWTFSVARFRSDGTLDPTFGASGLAATAVGATSSGRVTAVAVEPNGDIVAAGGTPFEATQHFVLVEYNPGGQVVRTAEVGFRNSYSSATSLLLERGGGALVGGKVDEDFAVARFKPDWTLDTAFGHGGWALTDIRSQSTDAVTTLAQQGDTVVAVGTTSARPGLPSDFALARYLLVPPRCTPPNVRGAILKRAKALIGRAGCRVGTIRRAYSRVVRRGRVISQSAVPGESRLVAEPIALVVSRGRRR